MESSNNNNNNNQLMFLSELKELRKELSAVKKRIVHLEESHEKQQERINILESENHALKTQLNIDDNKEGESALKRKRTDEDPEKETESKSTSILDGKKKTKTHNNDNDDKEAVVILRDNGDSFDSLSDDLLHKIVEFDGNCYSKFGLINKRCRNLYDVEEYKLKKQTCVFGYGTVDMMLQKYLQKRKEGEWENSLARVNIANAVNCYTRLDAIDWIIQLGDIRLFSQLCWSAALYGRINILSKVFCKCNLMMLDRILSGTDLCYDAALNGKLETLKWLRKYGADWNAFTFAIARRNGYDDIVQYLRSEGCPEPPEDRDESSVSFDDE